MTWFVTEHHSGAETNVVATTEDFSLDQENDAGSIRIADGVVEVDSIRDESDAWALQLRSPRLQTRLQKGDVICVRFEAVSEATVWSDNDEPVPRSVSVTVAQSEPFLAIQGNGGYRTALVPTSWHPFALCFRSDREFSAGSVSVALHLAGQRGRIRIRGLRVTSHGQASDEQLPQSPLYYPSEFADDAWRQQADERISRIRMTDLKVQVIDRTGQPVRDATLRVRQRRHAYAFGTFVGETPIKDDVGVERFRAQTKKWFNRITLPRYWADWGTDTPDGAERADRVAAWGNANEFELKVHVLLYPLFLPDRVKEMVDRPNEYRAAIQASMDDALRRTKRIRIAAWDAINELRDVTTVADALGHDFYAHVFNHADAKQPDARWFLNEYGILTGGSKRREYLDGYIRQIRSIRADGGKIEGIGLQGHFSESLISMPEVWRTLDELKVFGLPIEITEFDVDTSDLRTQARFTRDFLTAVFAHPATTGLTVWGFWEGDMWRPRGAMFTTDWQRKPNGKVWEDLVFRKWWTDETVSTDSFGRAQIRVFKGDHDIEAIVEGQRVVRSVRVHGPTELKIQCSPLGE
ncbi:MAG: endo-1,4-beta-xylanase [Planctomycetota bacterium]